MKKKKRSEDTAVTRRMSIKWRVFSGFAVFTAVILFMMWLLEIVLLPDIYRGIKYYTVRKTAGQIEEKLSTADAADYAIAAAERYELCVYMVDPQGRVLLTVDHVKNCAIHHINQLGVFSLYAQAKESDGESFRVYRRDRDRNVYYPADENSGEGNYDSESLIYAKIVTYGESREGLLLLNTILTPVQSTVTTLNVLFVGMTVLMILLAGLLAWLLSRHIVRPIEALNKGAGRLATGDYQTRFDEGGYREAAELGRTLNYAAVELGKVDGLRRELIANISHDLRTPLTMIRGYAELMRDLPGENTPENAAVIVEESARLTSLVNDTLNLSRLEAGEHPVQIAPVAVREVIGALCRRYEKMLESKGYRILFRADGDYVAETDEGLLLQAVSNLLGNAVTYTGEDKTVQVSLTASPEEAGYLRITVTDSGEGIPEEKLPLIWDRYYKVDKEHKRAAMGTGLGLSIVKSVMMLLGGNFGVRSGRGGSSFWIEIAGTVR